jgi:hypothetical protein
MFLLDCAIGEITMKLALVLLVLFAPFSGSAFAGTCTPVTSAPQVLAAGSYCLDFDVASTQPVFSLGANTTLDCKGHRIRALAGEYYGISASGNNVTIKNCIVEGFRESIIVNGSNNYRLINNRVQSASTSSRGIAVYGSNNGLIQGNQIVNQVKFSSHYWGIYVNQGSVDLLDNVVSNAIAVPFTGASMYGIQSSNNPGGVVARNVVRNVIPDSGHQGISIALMYGRAILRDNIVTNALGGSDMPYFCYAGQYYTSNDTTIGAPRQYC